MHPISSPKFRQFAWVALHFGASLFFLAACGFPFFRYFFMNDGYHDIDSAFPSWRMAFAAIFIWLKTALLVYRERNWIRSSVNTTGLIAFLIIALLAGALLSVKYASSLYLR